MTNPWWHSIRSREFYDTLVGTGMAWEIFPDLPFSWEDCQSKLKELGMEGE